MLFATFMALLFAGTSCHSGITAPTTNVHATTLNYFTYLAYTQTGLPRLGKAKLNCAALSSDGSQLAAGYTDGSVRQWPVVKWDAAAGPALGTHTTTLLTGSPDLYTAVYCRGIGGVVAFDGSGLMYTKTDPYGKPRRGDWGSSPVYCAASPALADAAAAPDPSPSSPLVIGNDTGVWLVSLTSAPVDCKKMAPQFAAAAPVYAVAITPDGKSPGSYYVAAGFKTGKVGIFSTTLHRGLRLPRHTPSHRPVDSVAMQSEGHGLLDVAAVPQDGSNVSLWTAIDPTSGASTFRTGHPEGRASCCAFTADGNYIAVGRRDGYVSLLDLKGYYQTSWPLGSHSSVVAVKTAMIKTITPTKTTAPSPTTPPTYTPVIVAMQMDGTITLIGPPAKIK